MILHLKQNQVDVIKAKIQVWPLVKVNEDNGIMISVEWTLNWCCDKRSKGHLK